MCFFKGESSCRIPDKGKSKLLALRGSGCLLGDVYEARGNSDIVLSRQRCIRAHGLVKATFVPFWKWHELVIKYPGFEADFRAGKETSQSKLTIFFDIPSHSQ